MKQFNINRFVKVKLTQRGLDILKAEWADVFQGVPSLREWTPPKVDENGYSEFQLWSLMKTFGSHIGLAIAELPFETVVLFDEEDLEDVK